VNGMDRQLRDLLEAAVGEPPPGLVSVEAVRRRVIRRRVMGSVAGAAAVAVIAAAVPVGIAVLGRGPRPSATGSMAVPTLYVLSNYVRSGRIEGALTPISTATNIPGRPIPLGPDLAQPQVMAITPNGKTIYVAEGLNTVTPVSTVTNTAGKPIPVGQDPGQILFTPDGKTAYVLSKAQTPALTPIATATNTPGKAINVGAGTGGDSMAITPDGKTVYVISFGEPGKNSSGPAYVIPISTATNTPGKPIRIGMYMPQSIVMSPDGKTAYVVGLTIGSQTQVTSVGTATNTPGRTITIDQTATALAITPDGKTLYLSDGGNSDGVIPFATATNTPGKLIKIPDAANMVITPDGSTAYVSSPGPIRGLTGTCTGAGEVTPVSTATNVPGPPIRVACPVGILAITPDGNTVWVSGQGRSIIQYQDGKPVGVIGAGGTVTPITTSTNTAGKPIKVGGAIFAIAVTP
jgi:DNA-binding beta-propeller fold protein YncE